jgi:predicted homoserine dehydrogenase-like protein
MITLVNARTNLKYATAATLEEAKVAAKECGDPTVILSNDMIECIVGGTAKTRAKAHREFSLIPWKK